MRDSSFQPRTIWMLVGALLGVLFGLLLSDVALWFEFAGTLFLNALTVIVFPLIMLTVIVGLVNLGDYRKLGRICGKTFGLFGLTSTVAVLIGMTLALLFGPGRGIPRLEGLPLSNSLMPPSLSSISGFLSTMIPGNLINAASGGQYLGLVVVSIILGAVLSTLSNKVRGVVTLVRGLEDILHRLVALLLVIAPIGIFFLTAAVVAANRNSLADAAVGLTGLSLVVIIGLLLQLVVVLPLVLAAFARRNPLEYYRNLWPAMLTGLATGSSVATYPVTYENVIGGNEVDSRAGSLVLPLSLTLHNSGSALFLAAAAIFTAQAFAIPVTAWLLLKVFVAALIVSLGVSGIPSGALFGLAAVGSFAGFPREALIVFTALLAIDWVLDRFRTVVNIAGDGVAAAVIAETFEFKTVGRKALRVDSIRSRQAQQAYRERPDSAGKTGGRPDRPTDPRRSGARPDRPTDRKDDRRKREDRPPRDNARSGRPDRPEQTDRRSAGVPIKEARPDMKPRPQPTARTEESPATDRTEDKPRSDRPRERRGRDSDRGRRRDQRPPRPERTDSAEKPSERDEPPDSASRAAESKPVVEPVAAAAGLSPDKIERELSAVRAQLRQLPERPPDLATEKPTEPPTRTPERTETPPAPERERSESRPPETAVERPLPPAPEPRETPTSTPAETKDEPASFGRGKHRKTPLRSQPAETKDDSSADTKLPEPTYATEAISFGRGKRKK